jgi:hypothetical protein
MQTSLSVHLQVLGEGAAGKARACRRPRVEVKVATRVLAASESCNDVGRARMYSDYEHAERSVQLSVVKGCVGEAGGFRGQKRLL